VTLSRPVLCALSLGTAATLALGGACSEDSARQDVLTHLAEAVIVPAQDGLRADADALASELDRHCAGDPGTLHAAWVSLRGRWSFTAAFAFGPVVTQMQVGPLDFWPVRPDTIEEKITAAPATIDAAYIDSLGTSAKGMPALEYLLFPEPPAANTPRCAYARALAQDIARRTAAVADAWHMGHADALATAGHGSTIYPSEQAGLDAVVNATIENLYRMVKDKLDRPLGNLTGSAPDPTLVESYYASGAVADLGKNLDGFAAIYLGADLVAAGDPGLGELVAARDPGLDERILAQLGVARAALAAIPSPLGEALTADRSQVQGARDEIDALRRFIKLDVASLLGVTLMLSDNDGD
jgi:predicted lipoprotein